MDFPRAHLLGFLRAPPRDAGAVESLRVERLGRLLHHAHARCPFYRDALERAGWSPSARWSSDDLAAMPVIGRATIRDRLAELMTRGIDPARCVQRMTSGTTGIPLNFPTTEFEEMLKLRLWEQVYATAGLRPWHRQARFAFASYIPKGPRLMQRFGIFRRDYFPMDEPPEAKIGWLRRTKPDALFAWGSVLDELSRFLEATGSSLSIPMIFSTSSALFTPARKRTEERFNGRVLDAYGAVETGPVAWDCPEGGYHVRHDSTIVELLDEDGKPAQRGRVVCTPLWRFVLPLIRADLGDLAEWDDAPCGCGMPGRRFRSLHGRVLDLIRIGAKGEWIAPYRLLAPMYLMPGVRQYQMVQRAADLFHLYVVAGADFTESHEREMAECFRREFGDRLAVRIIRVPAIAVIPGAKPLMVMTLARQEEMKRNGRPFQPPAPAT